MQCSHAAVVLWGRGGATGVAEEGRVEAANGRHCEHGRLALPAPLLYSANALCAQAQARAHPHPSPPPHSLTLSAATMASTIGCLSARDILPHHLPPPHLPTPPSPPLHAATTGSATGSRRPWLVASPRRAWPQRWLTSCRQVWWGKCAWCWLLPAGSCLSAAVGVVDLTLAAGWVGTALGWPRR